MDSSQLIISLTLALQYYPYKKKKIRSEKCVETSFDWNYNVCSHFAMIKLKLFELGGVDDVDVGRVSEW